MRGWGLGTRINNLASVCQRSNVLAATPLVCAGAVSAASPTSLSPRSACRMSEHCNSTVTS